jgi:hypothetical protein
VPASSTESSKSAEGLYRLHTTRYDRVASMLIALLLLIGAIVLILFVTWLSNQIFARQTVVPVQLEQIGTGDTAFREGNELDAPSTEEIREETDLREPQVGDTLAAVSDVVAKSASMLDDPSLGRALRPGGRGARGGSKPGRPRAWEVSFIKGNTLENYAKQLDHFGIELGVLLPGNKVAYAANLAKAKPDARTGPADAEQRYYLTWRQGELMEADRELLARAGIDSKGKIILKFLPADLERNLAEKEKVYASSRGQEVRKTRFGIRPEGEKFVFYVVEQSYR